MSAIPAKQPPDLGHEETLEERFARLAKTWRDETAYLSSTTNRVAHPAFQEILSMGPPAIPLLLREIEQRGGHWHQALCRITGEDPSPADAKGDIPRMQRAWLRWGKEKGYTW